jgi:hypothetical protein
MLKKPENASSSFDRLILRQAQDEVEPFQRLKPHGELVEPWATSCFSILLGGGIRQALPRFARSALFLSRRLATVARNQSMLMELSIAHG